MKIKVENIGPIREAEVEIGGLTVIAGRNSTGKSTVGKLLYNAINSFIRNDEDLKIFQQANLQNGFFQSMFRKDFPEIKDPLNITNKEIDELLKKHPQNKAIQSLKEIFDTSYSNIFAINYRANINLTFNDNYFRFGTNKNHVFLIPSDKNKNGTAISMLLYTLPDGNRSPIELHNYNPECTEGITGVYILSDKKEFVANIGKLTIESSVPTEIIDSLLNNIEQIIGGTIKPENNGLKFIENGNSVDMKNVADGIQQFAKLFQFIKVNQAMTSTLLVFDEPEIHLHPAWQLKMAEVLVIVAKQLYIPLLINTHSDIMLKGIKEYSKKYGYTHTKFYHAKKDGDGNGCVINNVEMDDIDIITEDLASPYYNIIDLRMENS